MTHAQIPDFRHPLPTPSTTFRVRPADPVLAAVDAHAEAWGRVPGQDNSAYTALLLSAAAVTGVALRPSDFDVPSWLAAWKAWAARSSGGPAARSGRTSPLRWRQTVRRS